MIILYKCLISFATVFLVPNKSTHISILALRKLWFEKPALSFTKRRIMSAGLQAMRGMNVASSSKHYDNSFIRKKMNMNKTSPCFFFIFLVFICIIKLFSKLCVWLETQFPLSQEYKIKWFIPITTCIAESEIDPVSEFVTSLFTATLLQWRRLPSVPCPACDLHSILQFCGTCSSFFPLQLFCSCVYCLSPELLNSSHIQLLLRLSAISSLKPKWTCINMFTLQEFETTVFSLFMWASLHFKELITDPKKQFLKQKIKGIPMFKAVYNDCWMK